MRYSITFSLLTTFLMSCDTKQEKSVSYFGGEIVNPNNRYVVLYKDDIPVDSAYLDENNRFLIPLNDVEEGLYNFEHEPEYQYVYVEKGDSIAIRLNTLDFDESLIFKGRGAEKNNFLIDMFLLSEDEERLIYDYYKLDERDFRSKMDSLLGMKLEQYRNLITDYNLSEDAKDMARASIDYAHYINMEIYPYVHKNRNNLDAIQPLSEDYYAYRETLNDNDHRWSYYRPYFNYMITKLNNLSYVYCKKNCKGSTVVEKAYHYHVHKLQLIDSLISVSDLKHNLYRNTAYTYLLEEQHPENNEAFIARFNELSDNDEHLDEINRLYSSIQKLESGKPLPTLFLIDVDGNVTDMKDIMDKTHKVFYFWSVNQRNHIKNINRRIKKLRAKYPCYAFIGITLGDNLDQEKWLKYINAYHLKGHYQFRAKDSRALREQLVINNLNKAIIVKADGIIIDAFSNVYVRDLEDILQLHIANGVQ